MRCFVCGGDGLQTGLVVSGRGQIFTMPQNALAELNMLRAQHRLPPFEEDPCLTVAANACAEVRATHLREGHTANDFAYLPAGCKADAAGCAAWPPEDGWGSCCMYDRYTYAGAAWRAGSDGRRYMHLFVRK